MLFITDWVSRIMHWNSGGWGDWGYTYAKSKMVKRILHYDRKEHRKNYTSQFIKRNSF